MVNVKGAQYWKYTFTLGKIEDSKYKEWEGAPVHIYAHSEEEARRKIEEWFKTKEASLLERTPW